MEKYFDRITLLNYQFYAMKILIKLKELNKEYVYIEYYELQLKDRNIHLIITVIFKFNIS